MKYNYQRYEDKVCVVTGAANGIGLNLTRRLIEEGAVVAAVDIEKDTLEKEFSDCKDKIVTFHCDVSIKKEVDATISSIIDQFGYINVLFNNAGIIGGRSLLNTTEEQWRHVIDVNINGCFFVSQATLRHMVDLNIKGVVVNMSSNASEIVFPKTGAYCASKGGLSILTKFAALEMAPYGIRVCSLGPGMTLTRIIGGIERYPVHSEKFIRNIPMGRFGEVEETTSLALFLGSDEASYCTGQTWLVDGGNTLF